VTAQVMQVRRIVEKTVWDCGNPEHNHTTRDIAQRCMAKRIKAEAYFKRESSARRLRNPARRLMVLRDYLTEGTYAKAGKVHGIGPERTRQICFEAIRWINREERRVMFEGDIKKNREAIETYISIKLKGIESEMRSEDP